MKLFKKYFRSIGNKGLSLVELICAMAILGVLGTAISGVMMVSATSFKGGNNEVKVQEEAQLVANQISDFLIDSTAEVEFTGGTLVVKQGTNTYNIAYDAGTQSIYYTDNAGEKQLMAENVNTFDVDVSDFATTGNVRLKLEIAKNGRIYKENYTVTARNKEVKANATNTVSLSAPPEVILIPTESQAMAVSVSGVSNPALRWTLDGCTDGSTNVTNSGVITAGKDERAAMIKAHVETVERVGTNPAAEAYVNVYIRRVNSIDGNGGCVSGEKGKNGATYTFDITEFNGTNIDGSDQDLIDFPANTVNWTITHEGRDVPYTIVSQNGQSITIKLGDDMLLTDKLTIRAQSNHANGANRAHAAYDPNVIKEFTIEGTLPDGPGTGPWTMGDGWNRTSNEEQLRIRDDVLDQLCELYGGDRNNHEYVIRFCEYDPENSTQGAWQGWYNNLGNGADANRSMSVNIRPNVSSAFKWNKYYKVEVKLILRNTAGQQVWPDESDPAQVSLATMSGVIPPVSVYFESTVGKFQKKNMVTEGEAVVFKKGNGKVRFLDFCQRTDKVRTCKKCNFEDYNLEATTCSRCGASGDDFPLVKHQFCNVDGIDKNGTNLTNAICYIVEKKVGDTWEKTSYQPQQTTPWCDIDTAEAGDYRVKVWLKGMKVTGLNPDGSTYDLPNEDWPLYDIGKDVFYYKVQ